MVAGISVMFFSKKSRKLLENVSVFMNGCRGLLLGGRGANVISGILYLLGQIQLLFLSGKNQGIVSHRFLLSDICGNLFVFLGKTFSSHKALPLCRFVGVWMHYKN